MIPIKSPQEISIMKEGGRILAEIVDYLKKISQPGIRTQDLENEARRLIKERRAQPSFLGFDGYPAVLCTSINEEIVHVVPSEKKLKEGDILSIDLGILWKGYHSDMAITIPIGKVSSEKLKIIEVTQKSLSLAVEKAIPGNTLGDIGNTIQEFVESQGFNVIRDLCGHGIGKELHESPQILNFGQPKRGEKIKEGMVFCIEPMVSEGSYKIKKSQDGFGFKTEDNSLSCHFEHTVAILKNGSEILTNIF